MTAVTEYTIGLHRGGMRKMKGSPDKLMSQISKEEEIYEKTRLNQIKKRERTEKFIREFRAGARSAGLVQSRIKSLAKQDIGEKLQEVPVIKFQFPASDFRGSYLVSAKAVSFAYEAEKNLISKFSCEVRKGDRLAVVGPNGRGKSTLLKLLADRLNPQSGKVISNLGVEIGYFGADSLNDLDFSKTILQEVAAGTNETEIKVRGILASMLFRGEEIKKPIKVLSGGEKRRVVLAKLMLAKTNLLILDEPTNHLDMESVEALIEAIKTYSGTVIFVSHDEGLIESLANRLIVFDKGVRVYENDYNSFLNNQGWSSDLTVPKYLKSEIKSGDFYQQKKQVLKDLRKVQKDMEYVYEQIDVLDADKNALAEELHQACLQKDLTKIEELGVRMKKMEELSDKLIFALEQLIQREELAQAKLSELV
jgi:ATP-binding cassette subfamily F protein 3